MSRNLVSRIAVAAVAIPIILWISYQAGAWLFGMLAFFAAVAIYEYLHNERVGPRNLFFWLTFAAVAACFGLARIAVPFDDLTLGDTLYDLSFLVLIALPGAVVLPFFMVTGMLLALGKRTPSELYASHARLMWGVMYIGVLYPIVYGLGNDNAVLEIIMPAVNGDLLLLLFGILWVGDTAAMGVGSWLGRHKLAPAVSPKKTVEGFIGGLLGAVAITVVLYFWKLSHLPILHLLVLALGCSLFGQLGDLVESMWKRSLGIKDSSAIIPGHGGVLDRFDSLLFAAPFMYVYVLTVLS